MAGKGRQAHVPWRKRMSPGNMLARSQKPGPVILMKKGSSVISAQWTGTSLQGSTHPKHIHFDELVGDNLQHTAHLYGKIVLGSANFLVVI